MKQCTHHQNATRERCRYFALDGPVELRGPRGRCPIHADRSSVPKRLLASILSPGAMVLRRCDSTCPLGRGCDRFDPSLEHKSLHQLPYCIYELAEAGSIAVRLAELFEERGTPPAALLVQRAGDVVAARIQQNRIARHLSTDGVAKTVLGKNGEVCGAESSSLVTAWNQAAKMSIDVEGALVEMLSATSPREQENLTATLRRISKEVSEQVERLEERHHPRELSAAG